MSEISQSILTSRVKNIRARLIGSMLIVLVLLMATAILYTHALSNLDQAVGTLEETVAQIVTAEQQVTALEEIKAARDMMRVVPTVWGFLIGITLIGTTLVIIRSIAQPVEQLTEAAARLAAGDLEERIDFQRVDEFGRLGAAFNKMATKLQDYYSGLEQQVRDRTQALEEANYALHRRAIQLEASAEVGQAITSILNVDTLLRKTVDLIRERFGFYHAGIFLLDETGEWAVLQEATGKAGSQMKAQRHRLAVGDTSMVGWTALHRQARIALYAKEDAVRFANPLLPHTRSEMTLPMIVGDQLLGVLNVQSTEESAFDENDIQALQSMANQVAVAIENARRVSEETLLLEATSPIYRTSRRLTQATTVREVADSIIASVTETGADGCTVVEFEYSPDGEPEALLYLGVWRRDREPQFRTGTRLPIAESPFPFEMVSALWTMADVNKDKHLPASARQVFVSTGVRALANIPLRSREKVIGQVVVLRTTPGPFSDSALRLYETLSDQAAVALERARLLEEAQKRAEREQLTRQMVDHIRRAVDIEQALQTTAEELARAVRVPRVSIELNLETLQQQQMLAEADDGNTREY
jgi:GAF domain-containing protein/HAMP domain-containing protein